MNNNLCEIVVILDRSGSMEPIKKDMMGGFDAFVQEQKAMLGECRVSLYQFDDRYDTVYERRPVAEVPPCSLEPRGMTALCDAVGRTITSVGDHLAKTPETDRPSKVVVLIITDGHENASREYTTPRVRELIERQRKDYNWQFAFLGADAGAFDDAANLGVPMTAAAHYTPSAAGAQAMYAGVSKSVGAFRSGSTMNVSIPSRFEGDDEDELQH